MAKERDGSINIYGSLQAKTEDGVVAYTDAIVHENEDGTKTPLDQLLKNGVGGGGIIDVDKLPQSVWSGTVVPVDGVTTVKNLYFNTNLSIEETIAELEKITYWFDQDGNGSAYVYPLLYDVNERFMITAGKIQGGLYIIMNFVDNVLYFVNDGSEFGLEWSGWNPDITYPLDINSVSLSEADEISIGQENDKLTALFSTTPFVYEKGDINDKAFYRLKESDKTHLVGTLLQSNPETMVNKVIFNDKLSVEETVNILSQLTYYDFNGMSAYPLFSNSYGTNTLYILKDDDKYFIAHTTDITSNNLTVIFTSIDTVDTSGNEFNAGWVRNEYTINSTGVAELMELPIGANNEALQQVLSMNNNFTEIIDSYKYTYWVYKNKWTQLIDGDNLPDLSVSSGFEIVDLGEYTLEKPLGSTAGVDSIEYTNIDLTKQIYEKITTKTNVILKIGVLITEGVISGNTTVYLFPHNVGKASVYVNGELMGENQQGIYTSVADSYTVNYEDTSTSSGDPDYYTFVAQYDSSNDVYFGTFSKKNYARFDSSRLQLSFEKYFGDDEYRIKSEYSNTAGEVILVNNKEILDEVKLVTGRAVYNALQNIGGGGGSAIVDVDVLPEEPKSDVIYRIQSTDTYKEGTLLVSNPQTTVNTIYFNTDLSILKTDDILRKLDYVDFNGMSVCPLFSNATGTNVIFVIKNVGSYDIRHSTNIIEQQSTLIYGSLAGGWIEGYDSYDLTESGVVELMGLPIGYDNSKLLNLISMNKTFTTKHYNEYYIYNNIWYKLLDNQNKNDMITYIETECNVSNTLTGQFLDVTITEEQFKLAIESNFCVLKIYSRNTPSFFYKVYSGKNNQGILEVSFLGGNLNDKDSRKTSIIYFTSDNLTSTPFSPEEIEIEYTVKEDSYKAVSSGGVFNALQEKQNKITVIENDDGTVDITIPTE